MPKTADSLIKIGEASKALGVSIDTLRRWERAGKITAIRTPGGTRLYSLSALSKVNPSVSWQDPPLSTEDLLKKTDSQIGQDPPWQITSQNPAFSPPSSTAKGWAVFPDQRPVVLWTIFFLFTLIITAVAGLMLLRNTNDNKQVLSSQSQSTQSLADNVLAVTTSPEFLEINAQTQINGSLFVRDCINGVSLEATPSATPSSAGCKPLLDQSVSIDSSPTFASLKLSDSKDQLVFQSGGPAGTITWTPTAARTITLPDATTTLVGIDTTQTLTNKSISGSTNTFTNIPNSALTNPSITVTAGTNLTGGGTVALGGTITIAAKSSPSFSGQVLISDGTAAAPGLAFTDDTDTGLYRIGANSIGLITGGLATSGITIDANGNVGVGTISPSFKLDVTGTLNVTGATTLTTLTTTGNVGVGGSLTVTSGVDFDSSLNVDGNTNLTTLNATNINATSLTTSGNVGIGGSITGFGALNGLNVSGHSTFSTLNTSGAAVLGSTLSIADNTTITGNGAGLTFTGTGNHDITASAGTLRTGAFTSTGTITLATGIDILAAGAGSDIGSSATRFSTGYFDTIDATNIAGTVIGGSTTSSSWTINSDNATADGEDASLAFERGTLVPNAVLGWNSTTKNFDLNSGLNITGTIRSDIGLTLSGVTFDILSSTNEDINIIPGGTGTGNVGIGTTTPLGKLYVRGNGTTTGITLQTTGSDLTQGLTVLDNGNVGIGTTAPGAALEIGGSGNVRIGGLTASSGVYTDSNKQLTSTAPTSGTLGYWSRSGTTLTTANANDIVSLATTNTTGADLGITNTGVYTGTGIFNLTANSATTGTLASISGNGLTTGKVLSLSSTSTALTTGSLFNLDWSPSSTQSTAATGNLFNINIGANATNFAGNLFNVADNSSSIFSISKSLLTTSLPASFTSPGDLSVSYDINMTNPTASFIKSLAPITIQSGESFNSSNLTLKTYNQGSVVIDSAVTTGTAVDMTNSTITTGTGLYIAANALTTGNAVNIVSTSTAGGASGSSYLLNLSRSGANANASHTAYGVASSVTNTGTTSTNIGGLFTATGATTNYGVKVAALTGATSYGVDIGALSGATANYGVNIGAITSQASATSYGINTGAISGAGTATYGINLGANSSTATTNYGINIGAISGAGTNNYGLYVGAVSGATNNYGIYSAGGTNYFSGNVGIGTTTATSALTVVGDGSFTGDLAINGGDLTSSATTFNLLSTNVTTLNIGDAASTLNLAGGSTSTGCTVDSSGNMSCAGNIAGSSSGTAGFWGRTGTLTYLSNFADNVGIGTSAQYGTAKTFIQGAGTSTNITFQTLGSDKRQGLTVLDNGNVGIGTTSPLQALHVVGQCVAKGTRIRRRRKNTSDGGRGEDEDSSEVNWEEVAVEDIRPDDEVLSLDDKTGEWEWNKVEKTMDMGIQEVFRLETESGKWIETTSNHPYLTIEEKQLLGSNQIDQSSQQESYSQKSKSYISFPIHIFNQFLGFGSHNSLNINERTNANIPLNILYVNNFLSNLVFLDTRGTRITALPIQPADRLINNSDNVTNNLLTTNGSILNSISQANWTKVSQLKLGQYIATNSGWEKIVAIQEVGRKQTYDLQIANTHNFLANNIVAHNTYITGNVGIGTSSPTSALTVIGDGSFSGDLGVNGGDLTSSATTFNLLSTNVTTLNIGDAASTLNLAGGSGSTGCTVDSSGNMSCAGNIAGSSSGTAGFWGRTGTLTYLSNFADNVGIGTSAQYGTAKTFIQGAGTSTAITLQTTGSNLTQGLTVLDNGNVGIGTTSPARHLTLYDINAPILQFTTSSTGTAAGDGLLIQESGINAYIENTEIGGNMYFRTEATNRLTLNNNGNLGIGTSVPAQLFQVNDGTSTTFINSSGNVGIGATTSSNKLDVWGNARITGTLTVDGATALGGNLTLSGSLLPSIDDTFDLGSNTQRWRDLYLGPATLHIGTSTSDEYSLSYDTTNNRLGFNVNDSGPAEIVFDSNGNVGIGTTAPSQALHVVGRGFINDQANTATTTFQIQGNSTSSYLLQVGTSAVNRMLITPSSTQINSPLYIEASNNASLTVDPSYFALNAIGRGLNLTTTANNHITLMPNGSGNVGIGFTSPSAKLHVVNTAAQDSFRVDDEANDSSPFLIYADGNVGIGATTSSNKLDVWGNARITGTLTVDGSQTFSGSPTFSGQILASDGTAAAPGYSFSADTNTGIFRPGTDALGLVTGGTERLTITAAGNVGIGTTAPAGKFHSTLSADATWAGIFENTLGSNAPKGLLVVTAQNGGTAPKFEVGTGTASSYTSNFVVTSAGNVGIGTTGPTSKLQIVGGNCADDAGGGGCTADYAELYPSTEDIEKGDLLTIDTESTTYAVKRSDTPYQKTIMGIVSTAPAAIAEGSSLQFMNNEYQLEPRKPAVALAGRVPLKVSTENGPIQAGDYITSSSTPGVGMKATRPGQVVGKALEGFDNTDPLIVGKVLVFVNISFADPGNFLASLSMDSDGNLIAPKIKLDKLLISDASTTLSTSNGSLLAYDFGSTGNIDLNNGTGLGGSGSVDVLASLKNLDQTLISLQSILRQAQDKQATDSANIAGIQSQTNSLAQQLASAAANLVQAQSDIADLKLTPPETLYATSSATLTAGSSATLTAGDSALLSEATVSGMLTAYQAQIQDNFKVFGQTILGQTMVAGDLNVDGTLSIENGSELNVIGTLYLQKSILADKLDIFAGKVTIDKNGYIQAQALNVASVITNKLTISNGSATLTTGSPVASSSATLGASIGTATLPANQTKITVQTTEASESAKIFITPTTPTDKVLSVTNIINKQSFDVSTLTSSPSDINFNWWIINTE